MNQKSEGTEGWYRKKKRKPCARCIFTAIMMAFLLVAGVLMYMMYLQG